MRGPTPRRFWKFLTQRLRLTSYLASPGDGRMRPRIPARALLAGLLFGRVLREHTFRAIEALVRSPARGGLGIRQAFGDDALAYFTERLDPGPTRAALGRVLRQAKANKAFRGSPFVGLAVDGTTTARCMRARERCGLCRPMRNAAQEILCYRHHLVLISIVGTGLCLPVDVEPYGPEDSEYAAAGRVLARAVARLGRRFADYVVVDAEFAKAPFLAAANALGLHVVVRLKDNHPDLLTEAQQRYRTHPPTASFTDGADRVDVWDAGDFEPWVALRWATVRVLRYQQHKPDGTVIDAFWLTDCPMGTVDSRAVYRMAKSRWEIENAGFNDAKTRYGLEHMCHHEATSLLMGWLLTSLALSLERLYRMRYLHRGTHAMLPAINLVRQLRGSLGWPQRAPVPRPPTANTS